MDDPDDLTTDQVCETLQCSRWTVGRMRQRGELEAYKKGRRVMVTRASLTRYIESSSVTLGDDR